MKLHTRIVEDDFVEWELFFYNFVDHMGISFICIISIFIIGSTCVEEKNEKDYVIKHYDCLLNTTIEERMKLVYDKVKHFKLNPENYYSAYICGNEMKIFVVMTVRSDFSESEFVAFMEEIPEL